MQTISKADLMAKLGAFESVENAPSRNGYTSAPNQFILTFENGEAFQSYNSLIGAKIDGQLYLTDYHDYSTTTSRHCGAWCGCNGKERRKGLAEGMITFVEK